MMKIKNMRSTIVKKTMSHLIILAFLWFSAAGCDEKPQTVVPDVPGGDFTLTDDHGRVFNLADLRGKSVLLYFGYMTCPDACPFTMSKIKKLFSILGEEKARENIQVLFVSVDPERDTPERLKNYLAYYDVGATGLTGSPEEIRKVADQYGIFYQKVEQDTAAGYLMDHTTNTYLIDAQGKLRHKFRHKDSPRLMASIIKMLLPAF
jgi:protein SCO1/2